jgi:hypothetical protein
MLDDRMGAARTVFRIRYLDYAGELWHTPDEQAGTEDLEAKADEADALLLVLDGRRVRRLLDGEDEGQDAYFAREIRPLVGLARRASCPVQVIVTKWDHVRSRDGAPADEDEDVGMVGRKLMAYGHIKLLVGAHDQHQRQVRLIPVSAVGSQFAELGDEDQMVKRADGTVKPINVDVPLCAVLPDVLKHAERALQRSVRDKLDADIHRRRLDNVSAAVAAVMQSRAGRVARSALEARVGQEVVRLFVEMLVHRRSNRREAPGVDDAGETQRLRAQVVEHMTEQLVLFEARLRNSNLRRLG